MVANNDNDKNDQLLDAARELFWKYGFKKVSVEEISRHCGVSKMTFYRYYKNKLEIAKAVFDREVEKGIRLFKEIICEECSAAEKIRKMLQVKLEGTNDISQEFLQDFYNNPELGLKGYIEEKSIKAWTEMMKDFKYAQEKGWFRKDFKPEFLLMLSQKFVEMIADEKVLQLYNSPQDLIMEMTNMISYGISPHD
jgi:AcrR family transcriptional regulator